MVLAESPLWLSRRRHEEDAIESVREGWCYRVADGEGRPGDARSDRSADVLPVGGGPAAPLRLIGFSGHGAPRDYVARPAIEQRRSDYCPR